LPPIIAGERKFKAPLIFAAVRGMGLMSATGPGGATQVLENPLDYRRFLDARDDPQPPAATPADLDVDGEHPFEALCPRQRPLAVGGRGLAAHLGLVGSDDVKVEKCHFREIDKGE
jgi:hypothetical protein